MDKSFFEGKRVTVFGLGLHGGGVGIVRFLASCGAKVIVTDIKTKEQLSASIEKLKDLKNIEYILGQHRTEDFTKVDMIIKSPPIPWNNKHIKLALEHKIPVEMDSSLFFKMCENPIIGVTGTKGKTTTASMIYEILKAAEKNPVRVGIGQASVLDKLDLLKKNSAVVAELSSWRLSALGRAQISPKIAVFVNFIPDHLNYYSSVDSYLKDKKNIFLYQNPNDWLVINEDDEVLKKVSGEAKSQVLKFSARPVRKGMSVFFDNGAIYLNNGIDSKKVMDAKEIKIRGRHNVYNIMAAIGAAFAFGVDIENIRKALVEFRGIAHRLEFVREKNGVVYYNDTAATIPESVISAIESFTEPVILIAGGNDKNLDFSGLGKTIAEKIKGIVLLKGNATDKLIDQIRRNLSANDKDREFKVVDSMEKAVEEAARVAEPGNIVLLSPGAASFGLFLNEFDRGDKFKEVVNRLKLKH